MSRSRHRTLTTFTRVLLLSLVSVASAHPTTLHFDNFNVALDGTELPLMDNAGNPLITGFVTLYQIGNPASARSGFASLRSNGGDGLLDLVKISACPIAQGELGSSGFSIAMGNFGTCRFTSWLGMVATLAHSAHEVSSPQNKEGLKFLVLSLSGIYRAAL